MQIAWTEEGSENAFLVLDRNHNGKIDGGDELFGTYTDQPECPPKRGNCQNGYRALDVFDTKEYGGNGDGIIDHNDAIWPQLKLWVDRNHNGISEPDELYPLEALGVFSLGVKYEHEDRRDQYGNLYRSKGAVNPSPTDGQSNVLKADYDVFLREK